uniref:Ig-like domain-containing protein n=1 Tax=Spermophilus dauricus TaxID=99837 RepID=A0A8C9PYD0_SPEDA
FNPCFCVPPGSLQKNQSSWLQMQEAVTVQEGLCVLVSCSFSYPEGGWKHSTPTYGSWYKTKKNSKPDPENNNLVATNNPHKEAKGKNKLHFRLLGDPQANDCSLSISEVRKDDSGTYYFHLEPGAVNHTYESNLLTLTVTELTQTPDIRIQEPLQSGHLSHVTCSMPGACDWPTAPRISWAGAALRAAGSGLEPSTSEILLTPHPEDHGTYLSCRVAFPRAGVSSNRTVQLNVSCECCARALGCCVGAEVIRNGTSLSVLEGQSLRLVCVTHSNPPARLSWTWGTQTLSPEWLSDPGVLELPRVQTEHGGEFTCHARSPLGSQHLSLSLSVHCELLGPSCSWEAQVLLCSCSSCAWPAPSLHWRLGEGLLEGNSSNASLRVTSSSTGPWANSSLSLHGALSSDLRLSCEAQNAQGTQSATVLLLPGQGPVGPRSREVDLRSDQGQGLACGSSSLSQPRHPHWIPTPAPLQGPKDASWWDILSHGPTPTEATLPVSEELEPQELEPQELHYDFCTFLELESREPQVQEATSRTEYSEMEICNDGLQEHPSVLGRETSGTIARTWSSRGREDAPSWCWAEQEPQFQPHHQ